MKGDLFLRCVREFLCLILSPRDRGICDNLSSHQVSGVHEAIEARGVILKPLPPYSLDLNPIEQVFGKLKAGLRKARQRTVEAIGDALGERLDQVIPTECKNDF